MEYGFEFITGAPCLDFADTLGLGSGTPVERLASTADLDRWIVASALVGRPAFSASRRHLDDARHLRGAIRALAEARVDDRVARSADWSVLNAAAALPPPRPRWSRGAVVMTALEPFSAAFSAIAADALDLLTGRADRIRRCAGCRMYFVDSSRAANRRWCASSSGCGNRAKVRRHRARARSEGMA